MYKVLSSTTGDEKTLPSVSKSHTSVLCPNKEDDMKDSRISLVNFFIFLIFIEVDDMMLHEITRWHAEGIDNPCIDPIKYVHEIFISYLQLLSPFRIEEITLAATGAPVTTENIFSANPSEQ